MNHDKSTGEFFLIPASEARKITDAANFAHSRYARDIHDMIHCAAEHGVDSMHVCLPAPLADCAADSLTKHGYRVIAESGNSEAVSILVHW